MEVPPDLAHEIRDVASDMGVPPVAVLRAMIELAQWYDREHDDQFFAVRVEDELAKMAKL